MAVCRAYRNIATVSLTETPRSSTQPQQLLLDVLSTPAHSLDNYVPGPNAEALATLRALKPGRAAYLWGPAGCGRTHLLRALSSRPGAVYVDATTARRQLPDLAREQVPGAGNPPSLIAVDDLHQMNKTAQAAVFALYNRWRATAATGHACILVVAGDRPPLQMALREDLRTRLGWDLVFRLDTLSDAEKLDALQALAATRGLAVAPDVFGWLLTHHERDMRRLAVLLDALDRYSLAAKRPITLPLLRSMLAEKKPSTP